MKRNLVFSIALLFFITVACAQVTETELEDIAQDVQEEPEDDSYLLQAEHFRKHPINLNTADETELSQSGMVTALQAAQLIIYRRLLGPLISIYELQAIPLWDMRTIRRVLPFVTVQQTQSFNSRVQQMIVGGEHQLLVRYSEVLERSKGFERNTPGTHYTGSRPRIFIRYRYTGENKLQYGVTADKDAGESIFRGAQKNGFDFYSAFVFIRNTGIIRSLAIGDFTASMGQGLIHWQGLAFKKGGEVINIKRQSPVLKPYSSAGEFNFFRGLGCTVQKKAWEATVFGSLRQLDASTDIDPSGYLFISSFNTSGNHRTTTENEHRHNVAQSTGGAVVTFRRRQLQLSFNTVYHKFSLPIRKREEPYNLYAIKGDRWYNFSLDYSYTYKNMHVFGEAATDKNRNVSILNGMMTSVDPAIDISIVHRIIPPAYQAVYGNAFTEHTSPTNESGVYIGLTMRPGYGWRLDGYADIYRFPWLQYLVDAPAGGADFLAQLVHTPNKQVEMITRFRYSRSRELPRKSWRLQYNYKVNTAVTVRNRVEMLWHDRSGPAAQEGYLFFFDFLYKPPLKPFSVVGRLQYMETDGYESRIYAYENDVLYSYAVPAFSGKGFRYYILLQRDVGKKIALWFRVARADYAGVSSVGSGLDAIKGGGKTEVRLQIKIIL